MSWFLSFMLAGMMITSQSGFAAFSADNYTNANVPQPVVTSQIVLLDETERFEQSYPLSANGKVSVSNVNGSITIESWDKPEVKLEAIKTADSRESLGSVKINIDSKPDYLKVETEYDQWKNRSEGMWKNRKLEVQYRLWVPRTAVLDEIETVNGSINVSNMSNMTKISTVNGEVRAMNLRGTTSIETVNGTVNAEFENLQNVANISLSAVNGTTNLVIPSDSEATIKAETVNGSISNDFGLPVRKGKYVGRDMYGRIGNGNVKINLEAVNGTLSVRRRQDGKNIAPATNLLPAKSDDDEDAVMVAPRVRGVRPTVNVNTAQINAEVARAMRESQREMRDAQREMQRSQKDAQKEMLKAQKELDALSPEIQKITSDAISQSMSAVGVIMDGKVQAQIARATADGMRLGMKSARVSMRGAYMPVVEKKSETFTVKDKPKVTVNAKDCKVFVRGWDKQEVSYTILKRSNSGEQTALQATAKQSNSEVNIDVPANQADGEDEIRVEVFVPKKSNLRILTDREIRVEGISGEVDLKGSSEIINVRDVDGKLAVSNDDGAIRIIGFSGELVSRTHDGTMSLEGDFQKITADAGDGTIILTLPEGANATLHSTSDEVTGQGFDLLRDETEETLWRIGKGGANFDLRTGGKVFVRNANQLVAVN